MAPKAPMTVRQIPLTGVAFLNLQAAGLGRIRALQRASSACATVWAFAYFKHREGHWPTQAEYASYWKISERSAQREWATFREAFPTEEDPQDLARWLLSEVSNRIEDESTVLTVPAPSNLVPA